MATKRITIEQLIPGMFVIEMDVPWYRTPFFSHKRLINDQKTIHLMKQHGIRMVTIDISKGPTSRRSPPRIRSTLQVDTLPIRTPLLLRSKRPNVRLRRKLTIIPPP